MSRQIHRVTLIVILAVIIYPCRLYAGSEAGLVQNSDYEDLVRLFKEWREFQKPKVVNGVPDYTASAMKEHREKLKEFQERLAAIDISTWPISQRVDHHLIRAEMNGLEFDHRVLRPWSRDPAFYVVVNIQFGPKMHGAMSIPRLPLPADRIKEFRTKLQAVPMILAQAKGNLTEGAADLAMLGIRSKERERMIFQNLIPRLKKHHPELVPDAEQVLEAVVDFRDWLKENQCRMTDPSGIGIENYTWYLRNVRIFPHSWQEVLIMSEREYERAIACMKLEEHRNRRLPPLSLVKTEEEFQRLFNESQQHLLNFLRDEEIMTVPGYMVLKPIGRFKRPAVRDYFQHIQDRDPLPLQPHDFVGHSPDAERHARDTRPIRGVSRLYFIDGIRAEAFATGMEEILMHTGLLDRRPRARELTYNLLAFRAARSIADLKIHSNEFTFADAFRHCIEWTPYGWALEDSPTLWHDLELYLRQPGYGTSYLVGSVMLRKLLADRAGQLGDKFVLRQFIDDFLAAGMIPLTLIRWEMTGLEDQIKKLR